MIIAALSAAIWKNTHRSVHFVQCSVCQFVPRLSLAAVCGTLSADVCCQRWNWQ